LGTLEECCDAVMKRRLIFFQVAGLLFAALTFPF
jgi:hypothetical protein